MQSALQDVGLSKKQTQVYLTLIPLGEATAYRIAEESGLKRPTVYVILEELRLMGLILKIPHTKKALYAAMDFADYLSDREKTIRSARTLLPQIHALGTASHSRVLFFSGLDGIKQAMMYKTEAMYNQEFCSFYGTLAECDPRILENIFDPWTQGAAAHGTTFRILASSEEAVEHFQMIHEIARTGNAQLRTIDYDYPPDTSFEIGIDFVRIISAKTLHAAIYDNKNVADAFRQIFNVMWKNARQSVVL